MENLTDLRELRKKTNLLREKENLLMKNLLELRKKENLLLSRQGEGESACFCGSLGIYVTQ